MVILVADYQSLRSFLKHFAHIISSKRQLLASIQVIQTISDTLPLTSMERNHLSHLNMQLEQIHTTEETMWA